MYGKRAAAWMIENGQEWIAWLMISLIVVYIIYKICKGKR